jgi:hypothetical protein
MDYDARGGILAYDEAGWWDSVGFRQPTAWGLAKYFAPRNTNITRVEFWTSDVTTDVDVYLYDSFNGTQLGNLLWSQENLAYAEVGYYSVPVNPPLHVNAGQQIVAVVKFTDKEAGYPVAIDPFGPPESQRCYVSNTGPGGQWLDVAANTNPASDVCIRLRYSDGPVTATPEPTTAPTRTPVPTRTLTPSAWVRLPIVLKDSTPGAPTGVPTETPVEQPSRTPTLPAGPTATRTQAPPGPTPTGVPDHGGPDAFGYTYDATVPFEWVDTTGGVLIPGGDDWYRGPYQIGFTFSFYGVRYTQFWVDTNGFIHFDGTKGWEDIPNRCIPNASKPNCIAAAFWDDLKPISGAILRYKLFGEAPNRYLVVEFNNVGHYRVTTPGMTFEAIFYEGSNDIKYQYQTMTQNLYGDGRDATIGIEDPAGRVGLQYSCNQPSISDGRAILFSYPR